MTVDSSVYSAHFYDLTSYATIVHNMQLVDTPTNSVEEQTQIVRGLAAKNKAYPFNTSFHVPKISEDLKKELLSNSQFAESQYSSEGFVKCHPLRHTLPPRGPGSANFANYQDNNAWLRVAGPLAILATDIYNKILPRYIPTMINVFMYYGYVSENVQFASDKTRMRAAIDVVSKILIAIASEAVTEEHGVNVALLTRLNAGIKTSLGDRAFVLAEANKFKSQLELSGKGGVVFEASKLLYDYLKTSRNALFLDFAENYKNLAEFMSLEVLAFAKAKDVVNVDQINAGHKVSEIEFMVTEKRSDLAMELQTLVPETFAITPQTELTQIVNSVGTLRPTLSDVVIKPVVIKGTITSFLDFKPGTDTSRYSRLDRSKIARSLITSVDKKTHGRVQDYREKQNGFQYQIQYDHTDNMTSVIARYPQAPQFLPQITADRSFLIDIEMFSLNDGRIMAHLITIHRYGGVKFKKPDKLSTVKNFGNYFTFEITSHVLWPYSGHDGAIVQISGDTYYVKQRRELDVFYNADTNQFGRYKLIRHADGFEYEEDPNASAIYRLHIQGKNANYLDNTVNATNKRVEKFKEGKLSDTFFCNSDWFIHANPELHTMINHATNSLPRTQLCYNIPLSYPNDIQHNIVTALYQLDYTRRNLPKIFAKVNCSLGNTPPRRGKLKAVHVASATCNVDDEMN